ncbi:MAM and LDL-receptor class A domain-containing protein 2-like [Hemicordylus capensis]|uniref:MAM and LDL-receptor class A domain-containing protein 2-like n=1 Tax=Hemicordylus capensis TaxID=884348 RepID=UPI002302EBAF|nr:MAM and LDL-receptor class A domain-containing protein 2-like [Hemicordylus capensis]
MVEERSPYVVASFPFGLQVEFDADRHLFIEVAEKFKQHLRGLCGIYSSNEYDEFVTPSGTVEDDPNRFGRSWMVEDAGWKCDPVVTVPPDCSRMLKDRYKGLCNVISDIKGPFQACQWKINPLKYVTSCVYDQCASAGNSKHCRKSLEDYAATCLRAGVKLGVWWTDTLCEPSAQCSFPCSFDNDLCLWTQSTSDNFDWTRHKGPTPSQMTGPPHDHTTGSGYYLYVEGDHVIEGDVAHLISPTCLALEPHCFSFWYHIFGAASLMSLRVYVVPEEKEPIRLWIATGRKANQWLHANVTVPSMGKLQIIVEGMRGEDFASDLAVDDISMSNGSCTAVYTT